MITADEYFTLETFEKISDSHIFQCSRDVIDFCIKYKCYWIVDLINLFSQESPITYQEFYVRWDFKVENYEGVLMADNIFETIIIKRRLPCVIMDDIHVCFLMKGNYLMLAQQ